MKYPRQKFGDPSVGTSKMIMAYSAHEVEVPKFDYPIPSIENFRRNAARTNPMWTPASISELQTIGAQDVITEKVRGMQIHTNFRSSENDHDYEFKDWFGTDWTWVKSAGGAMLTPGTQLLDDITNWEKGVVFPNLKEWDFEETADRFLKSEYDPAKALQIDIGRGCTERLVSLMGGYTEGMLALAVEPEAVRDFFDRHTDFVIELFDKLNDLYPLDMITYHDDWGTERDTFFSEKMMEDLVFEPTKKVISHIKSKGVSFMLHSCGNITRFAPYMVEMHADMLQLQGRAVDIPELKRKYGDKIGFNAGIEGLDFGAQVDEETLRRLIRESVDLYAPGGGYLPAFFMTDPEQLWIALTELYAYSREFYENSK